MRKVVIKGLITQETVQKVCIEFETLKSQSDEPILLFLNSPGGDTKPAHELAKVIKKLDVVVNAVVTIEALSAGFIILQSCTSRLANRDAIFMFHPPGFTAEEAALIFPFPCEEDVRFDDDVDYLSWVRQLAERSKLSFAVLFSLGQQEKEFSAIEALNLGLIDEIVQIQEPSE